MFDKSTSYMLAVAASIYGVLAYTVAFSLEIWFIFNSDSLDSELVGSPGNRHQPHDQPTFMVPMTALIQTSIYFVLVILSLFLVLGVIIRSIVCLLCWIIGVLLAFLPECALVIYTCLNVWKIETRNGQIELCFFVFRFIMNTFFVIFVHNLIKQWKNEKLMSSYISARDGFSGYPHLTTLRLTNPPFLTKNHSNFDTFTKYNSSFDTMTLNDLHKFKSLSVRGLYDAASFQHPYYACYEDYDPLRRAGDPLPFPSEFDTNSFRRYKLIRKPIDPELNDKKLIEELKEQHYYNSKKGSTLQVNDLDTASHSTGVDPNQLSVNSNVVLRQLATKPFDYLNRPGSVMNLTIPFEEDENCNIINEKGDSPKRGRDKSANSLRDVAL